METFNSEIKNKSFEVKDDVTSKGIKHEVEIYDSQNLRYVPYGLYETKTNNMFKYSGLEMGIIPTEDCSIKPFEDPLNNGYFLHYLDKKIKTYDLFKLYNDTSYLATLYVGYLNYLVDNCKPDFPPRINVEEFVDENQNNPKIKDRSKMNGGNSFMVYRKYLKKHLEILEINIPMQQLSTLSSILWARESKEVKDWYRDLSGQIKKSHNNHLRKHISKSCKTIRNEKDMKRNGGNSFMIYRSNLNEYLKSIGKPLSMTELSSLASVLWSREPDDVKFQCKVILDQTKKMLNEEILKLHYKQ
ncbi:hypothetical protein C1645_845733 [Glomus cerebriforme]|uniref:HMG box domain-containing protein n=1 Tax=Glomus cerebriforme TaxID=658196 RepID=A0A397T538_9GLOM|nr:hypothetical protein C1645_845733 [Glomus cerebriforme]